MESIALVILICLLCELRARRHRRESASRINDLMCEVRQHKEFPDATAQLLKAKHHE